MSDSKQVVVQGATRLFPPPLERPGQVYVRHAPRVDKLSHNLKPSAPTVNDAAIPLPWYQFLVNSRMKIGFVVVSGLLLAWYIRYLRRRFEKRLAYYRSVEQSIRTRLGKLRDLGVMPYQPSSRTESLETMANDLFTEVESRTIENIQLLESVQTSAHKAQRAERSKSKEVALLQAFEDAEERATLYHTEVEEEVVNSIAYRKQRKRLEVKAKMKRKTPNGPPNKS